MTDLEQTEINLVLGYFAQLSDAQRELAFSELRRLWCQGCGVAQHPSSRPCQCQNDE